MIVVYIFLGLVVTILVVAAFMPKAYNIEKTIVIKRPVNEVKSHVSDFNDYIRWNPWVQMEATATKTITGTPATSGHKYSWQGKKIGAGHLTIKSVDDRHIHLEMEFLRPWKAKSKDNWLFEPWGDGETKVTWQNSGQLPWPMARLMSPMINKNLNHQFGVGLDNLKKLCEGNG